MNLNDIVSSLEEYGASDPFSEACLIIEELFKLERGKILLDKGREYSSPRLGEILEKRRERIPLQYIIGKWEFMGEEFLVSPDCLIPRSDTEILVEKALTFLKNGDRVADFCTGSGCIGLSLLKRKAINLTLVDISSEALSMARKNADKLGLEGKCHFILSDVRKLKYDEAFDIIVSNPPYIPTSDIAFLSEEVKKEPFIALDGGENGLDIISFLTNEGLTYLKKGGYMLIEFGFDQGEMIDNIAKGRIAEGKISAYEIIKDYGGNCRVLLLKK